MTPNTAAVYGQKMAIILGKALLWACCDGNATAIVDGTMQQRILAAYHATQHDNVHQNPVQKVRLVLRESNGVAIIETCQLLRNQSENGEISRITGVDNRRMQIMENMLHALKQNVINLQNTLVHEFEAQSAMLRKMERLQQRMYAIPARAVRVGGEKTVIEVVGEGEDGRIDGGQVVKQDLLSKCPKDLYVLWGEYQFGLNGRKPARQFTSAEKGKISSIYSKQNKVWKLIQNLIHKLNEDYRVIIDSIYSAYGHVSVTEIIKNIQRDEKTGGHPNLR